VAGNTNERRQIVGWGKTREEHVNLLDYTAESPADNLAIDEALLESAEQQGPAECLRLWEPAEPFVVIGRASRVAQEVRVEACRQAGVPVLRRTSGGAAIVAGPGCLMYAVVLSYELRPQLRALDVAHRFVLGRISESLAPHVGQVTCRGTSDLACGEQKFSGNALRCKRDHLLYHGTLLYDFPVSRIGEWLQSPPRQPDYRVGRDHDAFVANLPLDRDRLRAALIEAFDARQEMSEPPRELAEQLAARRYRRAEWNWCR